MSDLVTKEHLVSRRALRSAALVAVTLSAALGGYAAFLAVKALVAPAARSGPVWTETTWPFSVDQWGRGRAFECRAADCGTDVNVFLRAKIGFCNCTTGIADDEELDRVGDLDLVAEESRELGSGSPITVRWMKGRSRGYAVRGRVSPARSVLSVAFNDRCDVIVATAVVGNDTPAAQQSAVLEFLNSDLIVHWAELTLGL
jgi:hypothetical protein